MNDDTNPNVDPNLDPNMDPGYTNTPNNPNAMNDPNMPAQSQQAPYTGMPNEIDSPPPDANAEQNPPYMGMPNEVVAPYSGSGPLPPIGVAQPPTDTSGAVTSAQRNGDNDPIRNEPILGEGRGQPLNDQPDTTSYGSGASSSAFSSSNSGYNTNYDPNDPTNLNNPAPVSGGDPMGDPMIERDPSMQPQANPTGAPDYAQASQQSMPDNGVPIGGVAGGSNTPASMPGNTSDRGVAGASNIPNTLDASGDTSYTGVAGSPSQTDLAGNTSGGGVAGSSNIPNTPGAGYTGVAGAGGGTMDANDTGLAGSPTQTGDYYGQSMDQTSRPTVSDPHVAYGDLGTTNQPMTNDPNQGYQPMQAGPMGSGDDVSVNTNPLSQGQSENLPYRQAAGSQTDAMGGAGSGLDNEPITGTPDHPRTDNQILNDNNAGMP